MLFQNYRRLLFLIFLTTTTVQTTAPENPYQITPQESNGIVFNRVKTVILAERYTHVSFLLPFPKLNIEVEAGLGNLTAIISEYWNAVPGDCLELRDKVVPDTQTRRLLEETQRAFSDAKRELQEIQDELDSILKPPQDSRRRPRRLAGVALLAAAAAGAGLLTLGAHLTKTCIAGVLGPCKDERQIAANQRDIELLARTLVQNNRRWTEIQTQTDEKFFMVAHDLNTLQKTQQIIQENQQEIWNATVTSVNGLRNGLKHMMVCTEFLFTRSQLNLMRLTLTTKLQTLHASLQAFRAAVWSYRATLLDAIPGLAVGLLPMALVPRTTLLQILETIHAEQAKDREHLTLALTLDNLLRYYETPLVKRAEHTEEGILITMAIPLTTRNLIMDVFRAITIPMPINDTETAIVWAPETTYLAVGHELTETALLTKEQLEECQGPNDVAICQHGFPTTHNRESCLASLYFHTAHQASTTCQTNTVKLPRVETAQSLGFGRWLISRRTSDYTLNLITKINSPSSSKNLVEGCKVCIITLECGARIESETLSLKAEEESCQLTGARRLDLHLSAPLQTFFQPPKTDNIPHIAEFRNQSYFPKIPLSGVPELKELPKGYDDHQQQLKEPTIFHHLANNQLSQHNTSHIPMTIGISLLISLIVQATVRFGPRLWKRTKNCLWKSKQQTPPPMAPINLTTQGDYTQLPTGPTPMSRHVSSPVESILQLTPADRLAIICATTSQAGSRTAPPPAYTRATHR